MDGLRFDSTTATAHLAWDQQWQTATGRADWLTPEPDVLDLVGQFSHPDTRRALDLGCGVGRHTLPLAQSGFATYALDGSASGLDFARQVAQEAGLTIEFTQGSMLELPYPDGFFDYVLAFNVIYHGDRSVVSQSIAEIHRVLKPGGMFQATMLSKRNRTYGLGDEIAPNTFVIPNDSDKDHPHFYCNALELCQLFEGFELISLVDRVHQKPDSWHWHAIAERR